MAGQQWPGLGVALSLRVAGCCAPCQCGVGVGGGWGLACRVEGAWQVGRVLCDVPVLVCRVGVAWWWVGGGVLVCCVGAAWWVGGGGNGLQCPHLARVGGGGWGSNE
ncbi:hypothetical protein EDB89DRAFT_1901983 [Lactarius sanguifluus]|nr:hypothetical protein EDB89DRAFT_1901983 [Lactarius sanguifluus]